MNLGRLLPRAWLALLLLALLLLAWLPAQAGVAPAAARIGGSGELQQAVVLPESGHLLVTGWAAAEQPNVFTTNLIVRLDSREIHRGRFERAERPDVVHTTGRADWLGSGFRMRIAVPRELASGTRVLSAAMRLGNGAEVELAIAPAARKVPMPQAAAAPRMGARLALVLAVLAPLLAWWGWPRRHSGTEPVGVVDPARGKTWFGAAVALAFTLLVAAGWTGSSLPLLLDDRGIAQHDERPWLGQARPVRSDEWQVLTPLALSQAAHQPGFPRINTYFGADGQNMLVIGMTGVPVAHPSALAKPATWGFFLFDLKRALAWYWWFPFFGCFLALWVFLQRFFAMEWRMAAGLALTLTATPYSVVFSGWPAYAVFFPVLGLVAVESALRATHWARAAGTGALAGLAATGFALVLYPAWQITLTWLVVPFGLAWFLTHRDRFRLGGAQAVALGVGGAVAAWLLLSWWVDARDAVAAIRASVYPGQRSVEAGGDIDRWFLIKGLLSPVTMYRESSLLGGASDAGSVVLFLLPALAAAGWRFASRRRLDAVAAVLCGYVVLAGWFMFAGFPPDLAQWTLWGSATSYRLDLALALAQVMLIAWLAAPDTAAAVPAAAMNRPLAVVIVATVVLHAAYLFQRVPPAIAELVPPSLALLGALGLGAGSLFLLRGQWPAFLGVLGAWTLAAALPFNPLGRAPSSVGPAPALSQAVAALPPAADGTRPAIAVVGERNWAMVLPAIGLPVVNGVFYAPPVSFWRRLDPEGRSQRLHNRYQRLVIALEAQPAQRSWRIASPRLDEVHLLVDPARFDFRLAGAQAVLVPAREAQFLAAHPGLRPVHATPHWTLYAVAP